MHEGDCHHIELDEFPFGMLVLVFFGDVAEMIHLFPGNTFLGFAVAMGGAGLDFDKMKKFTLAGDDIYFPVPEAPVPRNDLKSIPEQMSCRKVFAGLADYFICMHLNISW